VYVVGAVAMEMWLLVGYRPWVARSERSEIDVDQPPSQRNERTETSHVGFQKNDRRSRKHVIDVSFHHINSISTAYED